MAEPLLTDVFGAGASQDATTITISKASLVGLTPSASNTAESLLAALLQTAQVSLSQANFNTNLDQSAIVADGIVSIISRNDGTGTFLSYRQKQFNVTFAAVDTATFSPDDY